MHNLKLCRFYLLRDFVMENVIETAISDDEVLDYTQVIRRKFVAEVTVQGSKMPTDPKEAKVLLTALADLDRAALGKKRIKSEEEIAKMSAQSVSAIADEVRKAMGGDGYVPNGDSDRPPPVLDDAGMPPLQLVEGEKDTGINAETHEAFMERYEKTHGKRQRREE